MSWKTPERINCLGAFKGGKRAAKFIEERNFLVLVDNMIALVYVPTLEFAALVTLGHFGAPLDANAERIAQVGLDPFPMSPLWRHRTIV